MIDDMFRKGIRVFCNFLKYLRRGGVTYLTLQEIKYGYLLFGKKVLVTGGSSGIGLAIAEKCLSEGAVVLVVGRDMEKLQQVHQKLRNDRLHIMQWDMQDISSFSEKFEEIVSLLRGLDIVVNNAAFMGNVIFEDVTEAFYDKMMNTNLKSIYFLSRKACRLFESKNHLAGIKGRIINISSFNSLQGGLNPYFISKWGLNCLTEGLAKKYSGKNIIINGIAPGICDSSINRCNTENNAYFSGNKIHRIITPKEVAELAVFLMSDASNAIVGQTIVCDGGQTLR